MNVKWKPLDGSSIKLSQLPGWVFQLTYDGTRTLGVWTNGKAVYSVLAAQA